MIKLPAKPELAEKCDVFLYNDFSLPSFGCKFFDEKAKYFISKKDDIYLDSYPKTGTTWLQKLVYCLHHLDQVEGLDSVKLDSNFPYLEHPRTPAGVEDSLPSPRLIKTHLPYSFLPPSVIDNGCKIVYITRNPKDVCVSYYHFACNVPETQYSGTFEQFFERFLQDRPTYGPFWKHVLEFWERRDQPNIHFLFYEDLQKDTVGALKNLAKFLDFSPTEDQLQSIVKACSFQNMKLKDDNTIKDFFRKGQVGDWATYFTPEMNQKMDKWIEEHFAGSGLTFTYNL